MYRSKVHNNCLIVTFCLISAPYSIDKEESFRVFYSRRSPGHVTSFSSPCLSYLTPYQVSTGETHSNWGYSFRSPFYPNTTGVFSFARLWTQRFLFSQDGLLSSPTVCSLAPLASSQEISHALPGISMDVEFITCLQSKWQSMFQYIARSATLKYRARKLKRCLFP